MCRALNWRSLPLPRLPHFLGRLFRFPEPLTKLVQFTKLSNKIQSLVDDGCCALLKRTHLKLQLTKNGAAEHNLSVTDNSRIGAVIASFNQAMFWEST
jgi:hypothetical protein